MKLHTFKNWKKGTIGKAWLYQNQDLKGHFEKHNGLYSFVPDWDNVEADEEGRFFMGCILEYSPWKKDRKTTNLRRKEYRKKLKEKLKALGKPIHTKLQNLNKKKKCKSLDFSY